MGASLSAQEELFVRCDWNELIVAAMQDAMEAAEAAANGEFDAEDGSSVRRGTSSSLRSRLSSTASRLQHSAHGSSAARRAARFKMTSQEWQALMCLAEEPKPSEAPSMVLSSAPAAGGEGLAGIVKAPFVASLSHVAAIAEGAIAVGKGLERIVALREMTVDDHLLYHQDDLLGIVQQLVQCVFIRQYGEDATVGAFAPSPSERASRPSPLEGPNEAAEALLVMEEAMRHRNRLFKAFHAEERGGGYDGRPVCGFAVSLIGALCLAAASDTALRLLARGSSSTPNNKGSPTAGTLLDAATKVLLASLGELQALDQAMAKAGYEPLPSASDPHRTNSIAGNFAVVRRTEAAIQGRLLVADVARMRGQSVLLPPPARPTAWKDLGKSYVGQPAVKAAVSKHFTARARGVIEDNKATVLLFFGPSGHGKSELAKAIAKILHPTEPNVEASGKLVMIHLPSFCTKDSIYSLVDPPAAHVGEGMLLSALRKEPSAVVVLDEFEKSTADSIQHLWLSAFQKEGMLRSLKDAARSTSTTRATFILTCNLCDDLITSEEGAYLAAPPHEQERMRAQYVAHCREAVRVQFGEPFLNRVDFLMPFVPYSVDEKRDFASLQLSSIVAQQYSRYQRLLVPTPSYLTYIATRTRNFHTSAIGQLAQELLIQFPEPAEEGEEEGSGDGSGSSVGNAVNWSGASVAVRFAHSAPRVETSGSEGATLVQGAFLGTSAVLSMDRPALEAKLLAAGASIAAVSRLVDDALAMFLSSLALEPLSSPATPPPAPQPPTTAAHSSPDPPLPPAAEGSAEGFAFTKSPSTSLASFSTPTLSSPSSFTAPASTSAVGEAPKVSVPPLLPSAPTSPLLPTVRPTSPATAAPADASTPIAQAVAPAAAAIASAERDIGRAANTEGLRRRTGAAVEASAGGAAAAPKSSTKASEGAALEVILETEKHLDVDMEAAMVTARERIVDVDIATTAEKQMQMNVRTDTALLLEKEREISRLTALVMAKDTEIATLKETLKQMERLVALLVVFFLAAVLVLSVVVGMKAALVLLLVCGGALYLLIDNFFALAWAAVRAFFRFLGPLKGGLLIGAVAAYSAWSSQYALGPCPQSN